MFKNARLGATGIEVAYFRRDSSLRILKTLQKLVYSPKSRARHDYSRTSRDFFVTCIINM